MVGNADLFVNWARKSSLWYLLFATACCGIELMQAGASRYDMDRFGAVFRATPRQSDLMLVAGTITHKMADRVKRLYDQMPEPKYVLAMGACAISGGPFKDGYNVVPGVDKLLPVDVYVPGCPPRPETLLDGALKLHQLIRGETIRTSPWYRKGVERELPVPECGPWGLVLPKAEESA